MTKRIKDDTKLMKKEDIVKVMQAKIQYNLYVYPTLFLNPQMVDLNNRFKESLFAKVCILCSMFSQQL